jgi:hypothetical protein
MDTSTTMTPLAEPNTMPEYISDGGKNAMDD